MTWRRGLPRKITRRLSANYRIAGRALSPGHITVLTRTNEFARLIQMELRRRGVPSALLADQSVFRSPQAEEFSRLLAGLADPQNAAKLRAAITTVSLGQSAADLLRLRDDQAAWEAWLEIFHRGRQRWLSGGFALGFRGLIRDADMVPRLLALIDGERRLTNLFHLAELTQQAADDEGLGIQGVVRWFDKQIRLRRKFQGVPDEQQQRLESDADSVTLTTVHRSKGLEYPIVFYASGHERTRAKRGSPDYVRLPGENGPRIQSRPSPEQVALAAAEEEAEAMRLLYVGLTRARHQSIVLWGRPQPGCRSGSAVSCHCSGSR